MQKTCLIAAHDPWFIQLLKIYSEECGFRVAQAFDGQEVITKALHEQPAVILLQLDLPGPIKGREVLKMLHIDAHMNHIPVIVFSWQGSEEEANEGATVHLIEPVTYQVFVDGLQSAGLDVGTPGRPAHSLNAGTSARTGALQRRRIHK